MSVESHDFLSPEEIDKDKAYDDINRELLKSLNRLEDDQRGYRDLNYRYKRRIEQLLWFGTSMSIACMILSMRLLAIYA